MSAESRALADALPAEMARVRDEIMPLYVEIGAPGGLGLAFMRQSLDNAAKAMASGDVVAMLRAYEDLKGYSA